MSFNEFTMDTSKLLLRAVNELLETIGEPPIKTEDEYEYILEAEIALNTIIETKKEILSDGWDFNTDWGYELVPDVSGHITIPYNVLDLSSQDSDLIMREWSLYSKKNQSNKFDKSQKVDIIWDISFNNLTQPIRNYIVMKACRRFEKRHLTDGRVESYTKEQEDLARIIARRSDGRTSKPNLDTSPYGVAYIIDGKV